MLYYISSSCNLTITGRGLGGTTDLLYVWSFFIEPFLSCMYFYVGEMVIGSSIDLANRRKEARGHFPTPAGIKVINKRIKSAVAKFGDNFCPLGV